MTSTHSLRRFAREGRSSEVGGNLGVRYATVRADHHRILRAPFGEHDGQEIDTQGDAFFVAFRRAKDAVAPAATAQRGWPPTSGRPRA